MNSVDQYIPVVLFIMLSIPKVLTVKVLIDVCLLLRPLECLDSWEH